MKKIITSSVSWANLESASGDEQIMQKYLNKKNIAKTSTAKATSPMKKVVKPKTTVVASINLTALESDNY